MSIFYFIFLPILIVLFFWCFWTCLLTFAFASVLMVMSLHLLQLVLYTVLNLLSIIEKFPRAIGSKLGESWIALYPFLLKYQVLVFGGVRIYPFEYLCCLVVYVALWASLWYYDYLSYFDFIVISFVTLI